MEKMTPLPTMHMVVPLEINTEPRFDNEMGLTPRTVLHGYPAIQFNTPEQGRNTISKVQKSTQQGDSLMLPSRIVNLNT
jgi:hypothetical protein